MNSPKPPTAGANQRGSAPDVEPRRGLLKQFADRWIGYERTAAAPAALSDHVTVLGVPNARFWADSQGAALAREAAQALEREKATLGRTELSARGLPPANFLAVSGGSDDGSFGSGLVCGWSDAGTMPTFKLVTGVSTGSMIAPLAFLGRSYIDQLRLVYTTIGPDNVLKKRGLSSALFGEALADTTPLYGLIAHYIDEQALADITDAYRQGRLLLIGTASLDAQRPVIWNIGAIAASGRPEALELVRRLMLASAAIPGVFPPVMIDVEVDGQHYQEMNVDGGVVAQTFLYPADLGLHANLQSEELTRERHAYIIRNSRLDPNWASVDRRFLTISGRAIATMIHYIGYNDLMRIYATAKRDGVDYHLAYIEPDLPNVKHERFDPDYMKALFGYGYAKGRHGIPWHKAPPNLEIRETP